MNKDIMESIKKQLFQMCMKGKWDEVVDKYKEDKSVHTARITKSGDTALHVAVTDGQEDVVSQLVELIVIMEQENAKEALRIQNERKNTALHFAASMGTVKMIRDIGNADPSVVSFRNVDGETPLFLAALHGRKDAFLTLHYICGSHMEPGAPVNYGNCRRTDGDTILHCAIAGDNFDLAFQIIHLYGDLVNWVNESGATPLHLLASKPSAFRSNSHLGRFETFLYYGILVEELKAEPNYYQQHCKATDKDKNNYPVNYQTCVELTRVMKNAALVVTDKVPLLHRLVEKCVQKDQTRSEVVDTEAVESPTPNGVVKTKSTGSEAKAWSHPLFPANYKCCADFVKFVFVVILVIFGKGTTVLRKIQRKKEKYVWSIQIMNELLQRAFMYEYEGNNGSKPQSDLRDKAAHDQEASFFSVGEREVNTSDSNTNEGKPPVNKGEAHQQDRGDEENKRSEMGMRMETPILIAAKNGITEMVDKILELFPVAVHDMDANKKNIVLLAVESRQPDLYNLLLKRKVLKESLFRKVDNEANSALHLAAKLGDHKPWLIPGEALQMHWEIKWYNFVKESMPAHFFRRYNKYSQTPKEIFTETHEKLVKSGGDWLKQTSQSCSVVAALIATVAFATSTTVPGGVHEETGIPTLESTAAFKVFAISSLIALCCSVTAVVLFLSILTSRYQEHDFGKTLPRKLILGLTSLFMSITAMLVSFCAGHFLVLRNKLKYAALPIYAVTCLPVTLFAFAQFPLYFDLIWATFKKVPQRSFKATRL